MDVFALLSILDNIFVLILKQGWKIGCLPVIFFLNKGFIEKLFKLCESLLLGKFSIDSSVYLANPGHISIRLSRQVGHKYQNVKRHVTSSDNEGTLVPAQASPGTPA